MSDPNGPSTPSKPPPERKDRHLPVAPPRARIFVDSKFPGYCDRCGLIIEATKPRVSETTSKEERAKKNYGKRWHLECYDADGKPLGEPAVHGLPHAEGERAGGRS